MSTVGETNGLFVVWSGNEPASAFGSRLAVGEFSLFIIDCDGLSTASSSGCIRQEHDLAVSLEHNEPANGRFNRGTSSQDAVVLQDKGCSRESEEEVDQWHILQTHLYCWDPVP